MFLKKLAAVVAAGVLTLGLSSTPANAVVLELHLQNAATYECLDYRADYGPYATGCNESAYQTWIINVGSMPTAMRQVATRLCLVARNGQATMKQCLADDPAALWTTVSTAAGYQLVNNVTGTCLGEGSGSIHHVSLVACTGGNSQQWSLYG
jgi:hypothetical protein